MLLRERPARCTGQQALRHAWVKDTAPHAQDVALHGDLVANMRTFRSANRLKRMAMAAITRQLDDQEVADLREVFLSIDENGDGLLTRQELTAGLTSAGLTESPDFAQILEDIDCNANGHIDYTEFLAATLDKKLYLKNAALREAFQFFDKDHDGFISQAELREVLGEAESGSANLASLLEEVDADGDGQIDFAEFSALMRKTD